MAYKVLIQVTTTYEVQVDDDCATFNQAGMIGIRDTDNWVEVGTPQPFVYDVREL